MRAHPVVEGSAVIKIIILVFGALFMIALGLGIGFLAWGGNGGDQGNAENQRLSSVNPSPTIAKEPLAVPEIYKKRQFVTSDAWIPNIKYPNEITNVTEEKLEDLSCRVYTVFGTDQSQKDYIYTDESTKQNVSLESDSVSLGIYQELKKKSIPLHDLLVCKKYDGSALVGYTEASQTPGGGNPFTTHYLVVSFEERNVPLVSLPYKNYAYYSCVTPLQLTTDNIYYVSCGGGEGGGCNSARDIYKIDLSAHTHSEILSCSTSQQAVVDGCKTTCSEPSPTP